MTFVHADKVVGDTEEFTAERYYKRSMGLKVRQA